MALIKHAATGSLEQEVIVLDLGDLRKQADDILRRAQEQAQQILVDARAEAAQLRVEAEAAGQAEGEKAGYQEGYEKGRQEGHAQAMAETAAELDAIQQSWTAALESWDADRRDMLIEARQSLLELALAVARKIVQRLPSVEPAVVAEQVAKAIDYVMRPGDVTIRIHPEDRAAVAEALPQMVARATKVEHATLVDDDQVSRGGCVLDYGHGQVDATLDGQLDRIAEALMPAQDAGEDASP
jgi:flagellar assembly protein FliH